MHQISGHAEHCRPSGWVTMPSLPNGQARFGPYSRGMASVRATRWIATTSLASGRGAAMATSGMADLVMAPRSERVSNWGRQADTAYGSRAYRSKGHGETAA